MENKTASKERLAKAIAKFEKDEAKRRAKRRKKKRGERRKMPVENIHRDPILDLYSGQAVKIQFTCGDITTGRLEWVDDPKSSYKLNMYVLIRPEGSISFYKSHVKKINGREIR